MSADYAIDPLLGTATALVSSGAATPEELLARYDAAARLVATTADELAGSRRLESAAEVMAPLAPRRPAAVLAAVRDLAAVTKPQPEAGHLDR